IESRIDQDPEIKKDLALWNQQGSSVIRGNLLVIPIDDSILYVEPLYLQSSKSPFPELRRVIVADSSSVVMEEDLESALYTLSGSRVGSSTGGQDDSGPASAARLTQEAKAAMRAAQGAAARQDWAEFGRQMDRLQNILNRM
ncbi:MAG: hypothetical protein KDK30_11645, partial [Leptospiraceae bacterium]|nr:hypothetical protein [Leptospiraceae bacterium]